MSRSSLMLFSFTLLITAPAFAQVTALEMKQDCGLPSGVLMSLNDKSSEQLDEEIGNDVPELKGYRTILEPSADCQSIRIFEARDKAILQTPSEEQCKGMSESNDPNYLSCTTLAIVDRKEAKAQFKKDGKPVAYVNAEGALVTIGRSPVTDERVETTFKSGSLGLIATTHVDQSELRNLTANLLASGLAINQTTLKAIDDAIFATNGEILSLRLQMAQHKLRGLKSNRTDLRVQGKNLLGQQKKICTLENEDDELPQSCPKSATNRVKGGIGFDGGVGFDLDELMDKSKSGAAQ